MSQQNKPDAARAQPKRDTFFNQRDAIWLTDVVARELKEKQTVAAAPKIRDKPRTTLDAPRPADTKVPLRAKTGSYGPTKIVPARKGENGKSEIAATPNRRSMSGLLRRKQEAATPPPPPRATGKTKPKQDRSDFIVGAMGLALGLTCALFPWYIFFNQEQFGVREFVFSGEGGNAVPTNFAYQPSRVGQPFADSELPKMNLDFFPTATTVPPQGGSGKSVPVSDQPFPADLVTYQLVHVANGRAMIMDDAGLWVVQPGSQLPDASRVASIEKRGDRWVIVTTLDRIVELQH